LSQKPHEPPLRFSGWSWFPPHFDGEKIALVTDEGGLNLVGVNQESNYDQLLFQLLPKAGSPSSRFGFHPSTPGELVFAEEHDFWVLSQGVLRRMRLAVDHKRGLEVRQIWEVALGIGSSLQPAQVDGDRSSLYLVTQTLNGQECL